MFLLFGFIPYPEAKYLEISIDNKSKIIGGYFSPSNRFKIKHKKIFYISIDNYNSNDYPRRSFIDKLFFNYKIYDNNQQFIKIKSLYFDKDDLNRIFYDINKFYNLNIPSHNL